LAITREKKEQLVARYVELMSRSNAVFLTDYRGLSVSRMEELRSKIREAGGSYAVVKNTLVLRALEEAGLPVSNDLLAGPVGVGFAHEDVPPLAKTLVDFAKDSDILEIKGGIMEGRILDANEVRAVGNLPPREVVLAQLLGVISQPGNRLAGTVSAVGRNLAATIKAYADELEKAQAAA
jgi:large subunit ribosomal protein L10